MEPRITEGGIKRMKAHNRHYTIIAALTIFLALAAALRAQQTPHSRFYRVLSPTQSVITGISDHGYLSWTNDDIGITCRVQRATVLTGPSPWSGFVQVPVTTAMATAQVFSEDLPVGMSFIPGGINTGIDPDSGEYCIALDPFCLKATEVTLEEWNRAYQWGLTNGYAFENEGSAKASGHPVQTVNWYDCVKWCNALSEMEERTPCYYLDSTHTQVYKMGQHDVSNSWVNWQANGYRLPTEDEWEYACRGGTVGKRFPWGSNIISHAFANYDADWGASYDLSDGVGYHPAYADGVTPYTSPVGSFQANGYGLYDMSGNVFEWCWDWDSEAVGSRRTMAGGSWSLAPMSCKCTGKGVGPPGTAMNYIGFRPLCSQE